MEATSDVRCLLCRKVLCCVPCRRVHEASVHALFFDCAIYRQKLYTLSEDPAEDLLKHILARHLPLRCERRKKGCDEVSSFTADSCPSGTAETASNQPSPALARTTYSIPALAMEQDARPLQETTSVDSCPSGTAEVKAQMPKVAELKKQHGVITSTPTHLSIPHSEEFNSTISEINNEDSDINVDKAASLQETTPAGNKSEVSRNEDKAVSNQISSIHVDSTSATPALPKGDGAGPSQETTPAGDHSEVRRKRVTFAVELEKAVAPTKRLVFLKPGRKPTPGKQKMRAIAPRIQALVNNFTMSPKNVRVPQSGEDTPPSTEPNGNVFSNRVIDFNQESPTTSEGNSPKIDVNLPDAEMMSQQGSDVTPPYESSTEDSNRDHVNRLIDGAESYGKKDDSDAALDVENAVPEHLATVKRKRHYSDSESSIRNKRYHYPGRISGRRPLDSFLRRTILKRPNSFGPELKDSEDISPSRNRTF